MIKPRHRAHVVTALVVVLGVALTALLVFLALRPPQVATGGPAVSGVDSSAEAAGRLRDYVALGDSYAAGPRNPALPGARVFPNATACARTTSNYPQLVARALKLRLDDRTCSGASATDLVTGQITASEVDVSPQVEGLSAETDLVTVSIGANEYDLAGRIIGECLDAAVDSLEGSPCEEALGKRGIADIEEATGKVADAIVSVLQEIQDRSPGARVLVVGYANYFPAGQACPDRTRLARGDSPFLRKVYGMLTQAPRQAADRAGVEYLDPEPLFAGHLLCSDDPYVRGYAVDNLEAFHLNASGEEALARLVVDAVRRPGAEGQ